MGTPQNDHPQAFWQADLEEAADHLVAILRDVRPDVLVTYDPHGGYGHPDHIQTHRVATYAVALAAAASHRTDLGPAHDVAKVYWNAFPQWQVEEQMRRLEAAKAEGLSYGLPDVASYLEHRTCPDEAIAAQVDGSPYLETKKAAMAAHETPARGRRRHLCAHEPPGRTRAARRVLPTRQGQVGQSRRARGRPVRRSRPNDLRHDRSPDRSRPARRAR